VDEFREAVQKRVTDLAEQEQLGIVVEQCEVESKPPRQLQSVFDQVTEARNNRQTALINAHIYESDHTNSAAAQAVSIIDVAETARANYVASITADASAFTNILAQTKGNPSLYAQLTLVKTMGEVLTNVQRQEYLPTHTDGKPIEVRLMLNDEPPQPKNTANP
jgi:regulator of protease activity HflC (stomatin/prohibitin superfamily)